MERKISVLAPALLFSQLDGFDAPALACFRVFGQILVGK